MATVLGDAKIKLTLDTTEAEARIRRIEAQLKGFRQDYPTQRDARQRGIGSTDGLNNEDSPQTRDESGRAASTAAVATVGAFAGKAIKDTLKFGMTAEVILKVIQESPLLMEVLGNSVLECFKGTPVYDNFKKKLDALVAKVDIIQGHLFSILPAGMDTYQMGKGALRFGMDVQLSEAYNMYEFVKEVKAKTYAVEKKADRGIKLTAIDTFMKGVFDSLGR